MEKLTCSSCGATMNPNTTQPYLVCEYCDSAVENKYYTEPAPGTVIETATAVQTEAEDALATEETADTEEPTLIEKLIDAGKNLLTGGILQGVTSAVTPRPIVYSRPIVTYQSMQRPQKPVHQPVHKPNRPSAVARPAQGHHTMGQAGMHQRPDRPSGNRPTGGRPSGGRPSGGPGGRGGQGRR